MRVGTSPVEALERVSGAMTMRLLRWLEPSAGDMRDVSGHCNVADCCDSGSGGCVPTMSTASTQNEIGVRSSRGRVRGWLRVALEFAVAVLLQIGVTDFHAWTYDESLSLYGAVRVLHGQVPFRDFWTIYPPGEFWTLAGAFRLFGVSVLSDRVVFIAANAITAVAMIYVLDRLTERRWLSRVAAGTALLWMCSRPAYAFPIYPSVAMIMVAVACMVRRWESGRTQWTLWAGAALGVSALFRHDLAVYALIALGVASVVDQQRRAAAERGGFVGADFVRMCCVGGLVVLPVAVWLLVEVPGKDLYYDLVHVPGAIYAKVRSLPFPTVSQTLHGFVHPRTPDEPALGNIEYNIVWLPVLAVLAAVPLIISGWRKRGGDAWRFTGVLALTLLTALLFLKGFVRVSPLHMAPGVVAAFALLACLVAALPRAGVGVRICVLFVVAWASLCALASLHTDYLEFRHNVRMVRGTSRDGLTLAAACRPEAGLERARCMFLPDDGKQAILFLESESKPDERIFVGVPRYDILHASGIPFYFFSGREAATKWYDFVPGVETTAPIQNEMVCEIESNRTRYVVRDDTQFDTEPNESRLSSGVNVLGQYIDRNYALQRRFGEIEVLARTTPFAAPGVYCSG